MNPAVFKVFLYIHIVSGSTALIAGVFPMASAKGGRLHRLFGKIFFVAMLLVGSSALVMSFAHHNSFLFAIGVFSLYMDYTGFRMLNNPSAKFAWFDWVISVTAFVVAGYMLSTMQTVLLVFGGVLGLMCLQDLSVQLRGAEAIKKRKKDKVPVHLARMVGTYIAACTAFLVVNVNNVNPAWLPWLLPTAVGTPLIIYWSRRWRMKVRASSLA